ncbi:LLM class flavin-dependent oxidoreductase [uncultured Jatrophihabitans sp.]|uniref:LLM class flavin-dependent oxidoreductase n=1 Tax=uncultured Jatrophihabitans sp. TaxID=1610747 RepID=UPI0035CBFB8F
MSVADNAALLRVDLVPVERTDETMRLGYFAMPMHPRERDWSSTLKEDRDAVILADRLGFHDAFIGEHLTDEFEKITNSLLFLATLIPDTQQIKLATGTTNLSHMHPVLIAAQSAMFDHLADGRFILGISPGALPSDAEVLGLLDTDRNAMFADSIDVILAAWSEDAPYQLEMAGNRWELTTARTWDAEVGMGILPRPLQQPRPEIVGTVVAPYSRGVVAMGTRDFHPLSANFLLPKWVTTHWPKYCEGKESVGQAAQPADWRVARTIFVSDNDADARSYGRESPQSPYRFYYEQMLRKMAKGGRLGLFKADQDDPDESVTLDGVLDALVICGTPNSVAEQILALRETTGDFGELVYAGMDWVDPELARRSMELMSSKVMPQVSAALGSSG